MMTAMRVYLGSDHAGFELKAMLFTHLLDGGHDPVDCGALDFDALDDYPPPCIAAAHRTVATPGSLGIVIGGSGNGEQIAANKVTGVRAALGVERGDCAPGPRAQRRQHHQPRRPQPRRGRGDRLRRHVPRDAVLAGGLAAQAKVVEDIIAKMAQE